MRFGTLLLVIWLIIGVAAAGQRGYYNGSIGSCTKVGTIAVTIITGPLNYLGVNPKIDCTAPKPSRYRPSGDRGAGHHYGLTRLARDSRYRCSARLAVDFAARR